MVLTIRSNSEAFWPFTGGDVPKTFLRKAHPAFLRDQQPADIKRFAAVEILVASVLPAARG